jgi:DNA invertase Pin-like site-specific DNA recombinase
MRRSTKKEEQSESLLQQAEGIKNIANTLNISLNDIRFFTESRSGFENRTRQEWNKMIAEIDELGKRGEKCTLLCRDSSRLSRNSKDNRAIADRLF